MVYERLDRGLATESWQELYPDACEHHLISAHSDHSPLWFTLEGNANKGKSQKRPFRFENMWTREEGCKEVIQKVWAKGTINDFGELANQLELCGNELSRWNKTDFGHVQKQIREKKSELEKLLQAARSHTDDGLVDKCRKELQELCTREEIL